MSRCATTKGTWATGIVLSNYVRIRHLWYPSNNPGGHEMSKSFQFCQKDEGHQNSQLLSKQNVHLTKSEKKSPGTYGCQTYHYLFSPLTSTSLYCSVVGVQWCEQLAQNHYSIATRLRVELASTWSQVQHSTPGYPILCDFRIQEPFKGLLYKDLSITMTHILKDNPVHCLSSLQADTILGNFPSEVSNQRRMQRCYRNSQ